MTWFAVLCVLSTPVCYWLSRSVFSTFSVPCDCDSCRERRRTRLGGVYHGGPTPAGHPPIPPIFTPNEQDAYQQLGSWMPLPTEPVGGTYASSLSHRTHGNITTVRSAPIPPLAPNEVRALDMRTRLDQRRIPPGHYGVQTWAGDLIVLQDNYRGITNINGQPILVDPDTGTAVDVSGSQVGRVIAARRGGESVVIQTDRPLNESKCRELERAWREATG